ncbi:chromate transporter [Hominifimenecus sp. rT4P-3]|uniref:chromate transporter n=1 Tax=Hominifimenecus sp. rT4P-3 TaxID=3242979 RepID=UPI003DA235D0
MKELWILFFTFARIGGLTFGGGYAMLPMLQKEIVEKYGWATEEELMDYYAIGQCTPGIIAVNVATFVGYKKKKLLGALFATYGVVFPSLVIITIIAAFISNFSDLALVQNAFSGIQVCVCVLVLNAVLKLRKKSVIDIPTALIFAAVALLSVFTNLSPVLFVIGAGVIGVILKSLGGKQTC